jgi:hypothetical protein
MIRTGTTSAALEALTDLVITARAQRDMAEDHKAWTSRNKFEDIARQLDATRTRLTEDRTYLEQAWAFVDAGRLTVARQMILLDRTIRERS